MNDYQTNDYTVLLTLKHREEALARKERRQIIEAAHRPKRKRFLFSLDIKRRIRHLLGKCPEVTPIEPSMPTVEQGGLL